MIQHEVVRRRKWLTEERFLDLLGATNLIPGPNSTELAIHIGWERRRWAGLVVAGVAFIVPAMLMTGALGWVYVRFGTVPAALWLLYGVKPVILGVVLQAIWGLAPTAAPTTRLRVLAALAAVAVALGIHELAVLFGVRNDVGSVHAYQPSARGDRAVSRASVRQRCSAAPGGPAPPRWGALMPDVGRQFELIGRAARARRWEFADFELERTEKVFKQLHVAKNPSRAKDDVNVPALGQAFSNTHPAELRAAMKAADDASFRAAFRRTSETCTRATRQQAIPSSRSRRSPGPAYPSWNRDGETFQLLPRLRRKSNQPRSAAAARCASWKRRSTSPQRTLAVNASK